MKKIVAVCMLCLSFVIIKAQVTDSFNVARTIKPYLYSTLPNGLMFTANGKEVDFLQHIKGKQNFKGKPIFIITWSNRYCPPCIKIIDTIFNKRLQEKYNVVLINRDQSEDAKPVTDKLSLVTNIANEYPTYSEKAISLFDANNLLQNMDEGSAPMLIWMDSDLKICGTVMGYQITVKQIEDILQQINDKKIIALKEKYLDLNLLPSSISNVAFTLTTELINGLYTFKWKNDFTREEYYNLNFTKTPDGNFVYHKSSKQITKPEDIYNKNEIVAAIKQTLASFTTNGINTLKGKIENEYWSESSIKLNNFGIRVYDTGKEPSLLGLMQVKVIFKNKLERFDKTFNKKSADFDVIAKYVEETLLRKPSITKTEGYDTKTYTYFYNRHVAIILKENWTNFEIEIVVNKDSNGNIPLDADKKAELTSLYNESKLCEDIKKIEVELLKSNKSKILGAKNDKGDFVSLINIENFKGTIYEGSNYYKYRGYINNNSFESGIYLKEFELITSQLKNCLKVEPIKSTVLGTSYTFFAKETSVTSGLNSKQHNMWIDITVMK